MKLRVLGPVLVLLFVFGPGTVAAAGAQALDAVHAAARSPAAGRSMAFAPRMIDSASKKPPRWPFVLAGAVVGGATAGAWYAREVSRSGDDVPDLSAAVVGIGVGVGALAGLVISEVVRSALGHAASACPGPPCR